MPKLKNPLFSQEARGGMGGLMYNTWRGISYVKANTSPTGQGTAKRLVAQAFLIAASVAWKALTDANRAAWSDYASLHPVTSWTGAPIRLTGQNWFMKCSVQLLRNGIAIVNTPPIIDAPLAATGLVLSVVSTAIKATWTAPLGLGVAMDISIAGPQSKGITAKKEQAQHALFLSAAVVKPATIVAVASAGRYTAFVKSIDVSNGLSSSLASAFVDYP